MKRDEEREERDDHSVKVTQCKRKPCRAISKPPHEAEELLLAGMLPSEERPAQPQPAAGDPGCSHHRANPEIAARVSHGKG